MKLLGFDYYGLGAIQPCRIENNEVIRILPSGKEQHIKTTLGDTVPEQLNLFRTPTTLFYLKGADRYYVGFRDGYINTYRTNDDLLIGVNVWECALEPMVTPCGYKMFGGNHCIIYQDRFDLQSVYATYYKRYSGLLSVPMSPSWDMLRAEIGWCDLTSLNADYIFDSGGEYVTVNNWNVQDLVGSPDTPVFL